jgi:hypothetical protein
MSEELASTSDSVELADADPSGEEFENFDDLVAEVEARDSAEESFESFDDVIAEAEANEVISEDANGTSGMEVLVDGAEEESDVDRGDTDTAADDAAGAVKNAPDPESSSAGTPKRKKKRISFV